MGDLDMQKGRLVLDMLYDCYLEQQPMDTGEIRRQFASLADVLDRLPLREQDRVWDLACALCIEHEKKGFQEGVRCGVSLGAELMGA